MISIGCTNQREILFIGNGKHNAPILTLKKVAFLVIE